MASGGITIIILDSDGITRKPEEDCQEDVANQISGQPLIGDKRKGLVSTEIRPIFSTSRNSGQKSQWNGFTLKCSLEEKMPDICFGKRLGLR